MVECQLPKLNVVGSSPIVRSENIIRGKKGFVSTLRVATKSAAKNPHTLASLLACCRGISCNVTSTISSRSPNCACLHRYIALACLYRINCVLQSLKLLVRGGNGNIQLFLHTWLNSEGVTGLLTVNLFYESTHALHSLGLLGWELRLNF